MGRFSTRMDLRTFFFQTNDGHCSAFTIQPSKLLLFLQWSKICHWMVQTLGRADPGSDFPKDTYNRMKTQHRGSAFLSIFLFNSEPELRKSQHVATPEIPQPQHVFRWNQHPLKWDLQQALAQQLQASLVIRREENRDIWNCQLLGVLQDVIVI